MDQMDAELKRFAKVRDFALVFFFPFAFIISNNLHSAVRLSSQNIK